MITVLNHTACCGIKEDKTVGRYSKPEGSIERIYQDWLLGMTCGIIWFSDAVQFERGQNLADYIVEKNLGTIFSTNEVHNPNSGRKIKMWMWEVDFQKLEDWFNQNASVELKESVQEYLQGKKTDL